MEFNMLLILFGFILSAIFLMAKILFDRKIEDTPKTEEGYIDLEVNKKNIIMLRSLSVLTLVTFYASSIANIVFYANDFVFTNVLNMFTITFTLISNMLIDTPEKNYEKLRTSLISCATISLVLAFISMLVIPIFS